MTMGSEYYYLPAVGTSYPAGTSSLTHPVMRSATRFTRLVLSHLGHRIVAPSRGNWSACRYHPDNSALRLELPYFMALL